MVFERPNRALFPCLLLLINCLLIAGNTGCGGGSAPNPNAGSFSQNPVAPPGSVSVNPTAAVVAPGGTQLLTATVLNSTQGVNYTVSPNTATLTTAPSGSPANSILFTAPGTTGVFTVTATSIEDPTKTATATIVAATISISPTTATLLSGTQQTFTATILPAGTPLTPVFSVTGNGTIAANGNSATFTAPATAGTSTVTASVSGNSAISASATVTVSSLMLSPSPVVLANSGNHQQVFTAMFSGSSFPVTFSASAGTIVQGPAGTATFTAPPGVGTYTVTVTSASNPSITSTASVIVADISISPTTATLLSGTQTSFTATISPAGTSLTPVFTATGGTVTTMGNSATYTAPAGSGTFTVTAAISGTPAISASASVVVSSLALSPNTVSLVSTGTRMQLFTAMFSGAPFPVTFSASAGTIVPASATTATFTAPPGAGTYTITVASASNPAITGSATVNVVLPVVTVFDVDGGGQTNRPVTIGRAFAMGDIAACPRPQIGGVSLGLNDYQSDVKNRWPDGSVKYAVLSFNMATVAPDPGTQVTFINDPSCNNTGALTQAQMAAFNTGNWDAQMVVTGMGSTTVTTDVKTMLAASDPAANSFGDCKNDYWLKGPVVTAVIVQDCTAASAFDFGWSWNGTTMSAPASGNAATATFHPMFILYFYPKTNAVQVEYILETPWSGRVQDQLADITFKADSPAVTKFSHVGARILNDVNATAFPIITSLTANFSASDVGLPIDIKAGGNDFFGVIGSVVNSTTATVIDQDTPTGVNLTAVINLQIARTRHRKVFWTGTGAPGHIRIDHNFPYLKATNAIPNYDPAVTANPDSAQLITGCVSCTPYTAWAANDHGDVGGFGGITGITNDYSANSEGAPLQREDLLYLYNMASCGVANGACAKAYQMLTGESGNIDTGLTMGNVPGGAGMWDLFGNVPYHMRESRTSATGLQTGTNFFFCPLFDDKNAIGNTTNCGAGSGSATGKAMSRHAHSDAQNFNMTLPVAAVGTFSLGGWTPGQCDHWLDFAYTPYLLTGSPYFLEEEQQGASYCLTSTNDGFAEFQSHAFFGYINTNVVLRNVAWTLQTTGRAAFISPDNSAEASYYTSMVNSNLEVTEGFMGITGTPLTPAATNASCSSYNNVSANRWDFGRCSVASRCTTGACTPIPTALHAVETGFCPVNTEAPPTILDPSVASSEEKGWQYHYFNVVLSELRELGFTNAAAVSTETQQRLEEMVGDTTYNPYLIQMYTVALKDAAGGTACNGVNTDPWIATYARLKSAYQPNYQNITTFNFVSGNNTGNFACSDHGYSIVARAAGSFVQEFGTSIANANCPGGTCSAAPTWTWMSSHIPFFSTPVTGSNSCGTSDEQIKYALTPR